MMTNILDHLITDALPHEQVNKKHVKHRCPYIMTWIGEFRPGNKTIWVVFDEESVFLGPRTQFLHPNLVCCLTKAYPITFRVLMRCVLFTDLFNPFMELFFMIRFIARHLEGVKVPAAVNIRPTGLPALLTSSGSRSPSTSFHANRGPQKRKIGN